MHVTTSQPRKGWLRKFLRAPVYLYQWHLGGLLGHRFLLLTHIGRRTGQRHQTVLEVMDYRPQVPEAIVMSGFGRNSDWLLNIQARAAHPEVDIGAQHFLASPRVLADEDAAAVVQLYERRNRFVAPLIRHVLSRLLGWRYTGSSEDRFRLVRQLPLIAFRLQPVHQPA